MNIYKILVKNSNGTESDRGEVEFPSDEKVQEHVDSLSEKTGFTHVFELVSEDVDDLEEGVEEEEVILDDDFDFEEDDIEYDWEDDFDKDDFPRGWHLRSEFVAKDGTVFRKGEVQPDEFKTIEPDEY